MKAGKETVAGLVQAVRAYTAHDPAERARDAAEQRARTARLAERLGALPGIRAEAVRDEAGRHIHRALLTVGPKGAGRDAETLAAEPAAGTPPLFQRGHHAAEGRLAVDPRSLTPDEEELLVRRLTALLTGAPARPAPPARSPHTEEMPPCPPRNAAWW